MESADEYHEAETPNYRPNWGFQALYRVLAAVRVPCHSLSSALLLAGLLIRQIELALLGLSQTEALYSYLPSLTMLRIADWWPSFLFGYTCGIGLAVLLSLLALKMECTQVFVSTLLTVLSYGCQTVLLIPVNSSIFQEAVPIPQCVVTVVALLVSHFVIELPYKRNSVFRKAHSFVDSLSLLAMVGVCWLDSIQAGPWFSTVLRLSAGACVLQLFYCYQPYTVAPLNLLESSGWLVLTISSISRLLELIFGGFNFSVFNTLLPLFALPAFYLLMNVRRESLRDQEVLSPYEFELKTRLLWEDAPEQSTLREFFRQYKTEYAYFTLFYLWEYDFCTHCLQEKSSALVRVHALKLVTANFLSQWCKVFQMRPEKLFWDFHPTDAWLYRYTHQLQSGEDGAAQKIQSFLCIQEFKDAELNLLKHLVSALSYLGRPNTESQIDARLLAVKTESQTLRKLSRNTKSLMGQNEELNNNCKLLFNALLRGTDVSSTGNSRHVICSDPFNYWILTGDHSRTVLYSNAGIHLGFQMPELIGRQFVSFLPKCLRSSVDADLFRTLVLGEELPPRTIFYLTREERIFKSTVEILPAVANDSLYLLVKQHNEVDHSCALLDASGRILNYSTSLEPYLAKGDWLTRCSSIPQEEQSSGYEFSTMVNGQPVWCQTKPLLANSTLFWEVNLDLELPQQLPKCSSSFSAHLLQKVSALNTTDSTAVNQSAVQTAQESFKRSRSCFRLIVVLSLLVCVGCLAGYSAYLYFLTASANLNAFISKAGLLRFYAVHCTDAVRTLDLISRGYSFTQSAEAYQAELNTYTSQFKAILDEIEENHQPIYEALASRQVIIHEQYARTTESKQTTLWEALWILRNAAERYGGTVTEDSDFFLIYRNGPAELLRELDHAVRSLKEVAKRHYEDCEHQLAFIGLFVWLPSLLFGLIVGIRYSRLEKANKMSWKLLSLSDILSVRRMISSCTLILQEKYERSTEPEEIERLVNLHKSSWRGVLVCIAVFISVSVAAYLVLALECHTNLVFALTNGAYYNEVSGLRRMLPRAAYFWAKEAAVLKDADNSYFTLLADNSFYVSPRLASQTFLLEFKEVNKYLLYDVEPVEATVESQREVFGSHSKNPVGGLNAAVLEYVYHLISLLRQDTLAWEQIRDYEETAAAVSADFVSILEAYNLAEETSYFRLSVEIFGVVVSLALLQSGTVYYFLTKVLPSVERTIKARFKLIKLLRK